MVDKLPNLNFFSCHNVALNAQLYNLQTAEKCRKNFAPILNSHLIDYLNELIHRFIKPKIFIHIMPTRYVFCLVLTNSLRQN